jgi:hypothetical protein
VAREPEAKPGAERGEDAVDLSEAGAGVEQRYDSRPRALRGILVGLSLSLPLWLALAWLIRMLTRAAR